MTKVYVFTGTGAAMGTVPAGAKGAYAYRRDARPATPVAHAGTTSSADRADNAVMPVVTLVKRFEFDYSWGRSRRSFPFTRIGSMVSCQPFATPAMLDQNAIHNRIGITLLLWRIELAS